MARLRDSESVDGDEDSTILRDSSRAPSTKPRQSYNNPDSASHSPTPSIGSDKENRSRQPTKDRSMPPPPPPNANKRRRTGERPETLNDQDHTPNNSRPSSRAPSASVPPTSVREGSVSTYDPHQSIHERQTLRKGLRDLNFQVLDNRNEWLAPGSSGLLNAITSANTLSKRVKQTSDATIDSRFLVNAGDLAYKKTQAASVGDGAQGIDVDDFVSKCIAFMRKGDEEEAANAGSASTQHRPQQTQSRRRPARTQTEIDSDEEDLAAAGDAFNWAYLGSHAAFPATCRPPAPSFLLGPLSVQKKARTQTQRRARQTRVDPAEAVKPRELQVGDLQRQEDSSLTAMCKKIHVQLRSLVNEAERAEEANVPDEEMDEICERNRVCDNGGVSLFHFAFNPNSFGQTVENLFYVSFLIKEGTVGVDFDQDGKPTLHYQNPQSTTDPTSNTASTNSKKHHSVLSIDFSDWQTACNAFDIEESLIKNRVVPPGEGDQGRGMEVDGDESADGGSGNEDGDGGEGRGRGRVGRSAWYG